MYANNLRYLQVINTPSAEQDADGNTYFIRSSATIPANLTIDNKLIYSSAYKKCGREGEQVQINIPDSDEAFTQLQRTAFQNDALVMLRYDYFHYLAILIPAELCTDLYSITQTTGNQNINVAVDNPSYHKDTAQTIRHEQMITEVMSDEIDAEILQRVLNTSPTAGTEVKKIAKTRRAHSAVFYFWNGISVSYAISLQHLYYAQVTLKNGLNVPERNA